MILLSEDDVIMIELDMHMIFKILLLWIFNS